MNTHFTHSANRYFSGKLGLPQESLNIEAPLTPGGLVWLVASNNQQSRTNWGGVGADGRWVTFRLTGTKASEQSFGQAEEDLSLAFPSLREHRTDGLILSRLAVEEPDGPPIWAGTSKFRNLPDGSTVIDENEVLYSYADPTDRYPHGALGDRIEWMGLVAGPVHHNRVPDKFSLPENEVFEGLFPLVADLDGNDGLEILTTVSDPENGARLVAFRYDDFHLTIIAESDPVGTGFRWLHQIAVAPFGPNGEIEIAVVETPHVGGIAKFYRLVGNRLELVASEPGGYMSHVNGSRNLDQAVAGDFDGDGSVELLVPSRDQESLVALRRVGDSVEEVWKLDLGARLSSNLSVLETEDDKLILGAATEDGVLHIWQ